MVPKIEFISRTEIVDPFLKGLKKSLIKDEFNSLASIRNNGLINLQTYGRKYPRI